MQPILEALYAQRQSLEAAIAAIVGKGANATATDLAMLKAYRRSLQAVNAQIIVFVNTPPEVPDEELNDIPF